LLSRPITFGQSETLIVRPRLGRLARGWAARRKEALAGADRRFGKPGAEGDFYGVREWHVGDSRRLIHWRSSARIGKLVVRQLERPRSRDVAVVLDLWQPEPHTAEHADNVELAVSFAATVVSDLCRKGGSNVCLGITNGGPECIGGAASSATLQGLMEQLALVEPRSDDSLPALLVAVLRQIAAGTEVVLVSTRPVDLADATQFVDILSDPAMRERARRILCIDTSSERLAQFFSAE
jgi:uncharacterized protein (DUF58 family)